ncbi:MAG TPA: GspH/FimT family pseudopilin [Fimbriimonas sp.]|nr:GspH/FimT family pseudopilin [Fimbriimonas sp.]
MRRAGFTLVEVMTVVFIITVLASTLISRIFVQHRGIDFRQSVQKIESTANQARRLAIESGRPATLDFDQAQQALTITQDSGDDNNAGIGDDKPEPTESVIGEGWSLQEVRLPDGTTDTELSIVFQPDGSATAKTAVLASDGSEVTLKVLSNGKIEVIRGTIDDEDTNQDEEWEAGSIEQRSAG